jgi:amino acid transporter
MAFIVMGVIATALLVGNAALSTWLGTDSPDNVFLMVFNLSAFCFLVSYLMVFPSFLILRYRRPEQPRPYRMPGGLAVAWIATVVCWVFIAAACLLFFKPSAAAPNPTLETRRLVFLGAEALATLVVGLLLIPKPKAPES